MSTLTLLPPVPAVVLPEVRTVHLTSGAILVLIDGSGNIARDITLRYAARALAALERGDLDTASGHLTDAEAVARCAYPPGTDQARGLDLILGVIRRAWTRGGTA